MNFALSDEQVLLREAARGALSRFKTIEAARDALEDPTALPDLWPTAVEAGWPGLLIDEEHGGAGLGAFDALLVAEECGRVLAPRPAARAAARDGDPQRGRRRVARRGRGRRAASGVRAGAAPRAISSRAWTVEPRTGHARGARAAGHASTATRWCSTGRSRSSPMRPGADLLVAIGVSADGAAGRRRDAGRRRRRVGRTGDALRRDPLARPRHVLRRPAAGASTSTPACSPTPGISRRR